MWKGQHLIQLDEIWSSFRTVKQSIFGSILFWYERDPSAFLRPLFFERETPLPFFCRWERETHDLLLEREWSLDLIPHRKLVCVRALVESHSFLTRRNCLMNCVTGHFFVTEKWITLRWPFVTSRHSRFYKRQDKQEKRKVWPKITWLDLMILFLCWLVDIHMIE